MVGARFPGCPRSCRSACHGWTHGGYGQVGRQVQAQATTIARAVLAHLAELEVLVNPSLRARYLRDIIEPTFSTADAAVATWAPAEGEQQTPNPRLITRMQAALVLGCVVLRLCGEPLLQQRWNEVPDLVADMIFNSTGAGHANDTTS
jgi:hypothetical protein